jgi:integrase
MSAINIRSLKPIDWPEADRVAWMTAKQPGHRLKAGGRAGHLRPATQSMLEKAYGQFLGFCERKGRLDRCAKAADHLEEELIDAFLDELRVRVSSVSRAMWLQRVHRMAQLLAPERDYAWLRDIVWELKGEQRPRPKAHRVIETTRIVEAGIKLMERAETGGGTNLQRALVFRDGLMIALLGFCPMRLKNFAGLTIGKQVRRDGPGWWIFLDRTETKQKRPDQRPVPDVLADPLNRWIYHWRMFFLNPGDVLWPSVKGGRMAYTYVGTTVSAITRRELDVDISPHLFRDCAVYTVATRAGQEMGIASAILQHSDPRVTDEHYNKGAMVEAARSLQLLIISLDNR